MVYGLRCHSHHHIQTMVIVYGDDDSEGDVDCAGDDCDDVQTIESVKSAIFKIKSIYYLGTCDLICGV